jgi:hypothetical protein
VKNRPRAVCRVARGDWSLHRKARNRERFLEGCFYEGDFYGLRSRAIKNAALMGDGILKVVEHHGRVRYENVFPGTLLVDELEAAETKQPRTVIQVRCYDRGVAKALWPGHDAAIEAAMAPSAAAYGRDPVSDQCLVYEAWHLPSGPKEKDGRHVIVVDSNDGLLMSERWESERFPFARWLWSDNPLGYWSDGLGEMLTGIQFEINQILRLIQNNTYLGGNLKILVQKGSNIADAQISNTLRGAKIEYVGQPPVFHTHDIVTEQLIRHLWTLVEQAYNVTGISQLSAQGEIPSGLAGSGRAQLVYKNIESERFANFARGDEIALKDISVLTFDAVKRIAEREGKYEVRAPSKNWLYTLDAKDLIAEDGDFEFQVQSASQLPHDLAGRIAIGEQLTSLGWLGKDQAMALADIASDLDAELALETAPQELIDQAIEQILEEKIPQQVLPYQDLQLTVRRGALAWQRAQINGAPAESLDLLNQYIQAAIDLNTPPPVSDEMQGQPGAVPPAPTPPPAPPMPAGPAPMNGAPLQ